jgi:thioredoxin-related protein
MYRLILLLICFLSFALSVQAQQSVSFEQLTKLQANEKLPVLVFIQTDWCKFCGLMKQTLKNDTTIRQLIKRSFYFVALNGEEQRTITFGGRAFKYKPTGALTGNHELAIALATVKGQLSYPTLCFLNADNEIIYQHVGYLDSPALLETLKLIQRSN